MGVLTDIYERIGLLRGKETRRVMGLMSGTSADGITVALTDITGTGREAKVHLLEYKTYPYDDELRSRIFRLFNPY